MSLPQHSALPSSLPARALALIETDTALWRSFCLFAVLIPISVAAAQSALGVAVTLGAARWWRLGRPRPRTPLDAPILAFLASAILGACLGLDAAQSLWGIRTYLQVSIVYLALATVRDDGRLRKILACFLGSMVLTSTHTALNAVSPWRLPSLFPGSMTESGQLLFAISLSSSLLVSRRFWPRALPWTLALHIAALLANLKRGVWLGVAVSVVLVGAGASRRLVGAAAVVLAAAVILLTPVRGRIAATAGDLLLPGSRYDIWSASVDVIRRYPMGVGRKNGTILRDYPNIPANHKHAHNNVLQITLENGFLGLAAFLWWMVRFGRLSWGAWRRLPAASGIESAVALAVFSSFIGFHVAGLVEYNFGDTEVLEVFFLMMGLGVRAARQPDAATPVATRQGTIL